MKIPQEIIKTAKEHGYDSAEYIGAKNDKGREGISTYP